MMDYKLPVTYMSFIAIRLSRLSQVSQDTRVSTGYVLTPSTKLCTLFLWGGASMMRTVSRCPRILPSYPPTWCSPIAGYLGSSRVVPPTYSQTVSGILNILGYLGLFGVFPLHIPRPSVHGILSIPGYLGSIQVVPLHTPRLSVHGILGYLGSSQVVPLTYSQT